MGTGAGDGSRRHAMGGDVMPRFALFLPIVLAVVLAVPAGPAPEPDAAQLESGAFLPVNFAGADPFGGAPPPSGAVRLATFDGARANGVWRLSVYDDTDNDGGSLGEGWALTIAAKVKKKRN